MRPFVDKYGEEYQYDTYKVAYDFVEYLLFKDGERFVSAAIESLYKVGPWADDNIERNSDYDERVIDDIIERSDELYQIYEPLDNMLGNISYDELDGYSDENKIMLILERHISVIAGYSEEDLSLIRDIAEADWDDDYSFYWYMVNNFCTIPEPTQDDEFDEDDDCELLINSQYEREYLDDEDEDEDDY